jgi:hypothetical protein
VKDKATSQKGEAVDPVVFDYHRGQPYREHLMRKVLRGYTKDKNGNLIVIGTIVVPHSKDKRSPKERQEKRHLVRQGATTFKEEFVR